MPDFSELNEQALVASGLSDVEHVVVAMWWLQGGLVDRVPDEATATTLPSAIAADLHHPAWPAVPEFMISAMTWPLQLPVASILNG